MNSDAKISDIERGTTEKGYTIEKGSAVSNTLVQEILHLDDFWPPIKLYESTALVFRTANLIWILLIALFLSYTAISINNALNERDSPPTSVTVSPVPEEGFRIPYITICGISGGEYPFAHFVESVSNSGSYWGSLDNGFTSFQGTFQQPITQFENLNGFPEVNQNECLGLDLADVKIGTFTHTFQVRIENRGSYGSGSWVQIYLSEQKPIDYSYISKYGTSAILGGGSWVIATVKKTIRQNIKRGSKSYPAPLEIPIESYSLVNLVTKEIQGDLNSYTLTLMANPDGITFVTENDPFSIEAIIANISAIFSFLTMIFFFIFSKPMKRIEFYEKREEINELLNSPAPSSP
jgi:hypothetical protein